MRKDDVLAYFGGPKKSQTKTAAALGVTKSAVNQWPDPIPLKQAIKANARSNGDLRLDMSVYELPEIHGRSKSHRRHAIA